MFKKITEYFKKKEPKIKKDKNIKKPNTDKDGFINLPLNEEWETNTKKWQDCTKMVDNPKTEEKQ